jgi:hypothetical protein
MDFSTGWYDKADTFESKALNPASGIPKAGWAQAINGQSQNIPYCRYLHCLSTRKTSEPQARIPSDRNGAHYENFVLVT